MTKKRFLCAAALFLITLITLARVSQAQFQGGQGGQTGISGRGGSVGTNPRDSQNAQPAQPVSKEPPPLESDLVLLTVSVTGPDNKALPALTQDRFQVLEDGVEQKILYFWEDSRPISVGFLLDDSSYMSVNNKYDDLRDVIPAFLKGKNPEDEYFLIQFSTFPRMTVSYTTDTKQAPPSIGGTGADNSTPDTALNDGIYMGLESIKEAANPRKALLVVTAGGDRGCDGSLQTMKSEQLLGFAVKQPVQIYSAMIAEDWTMSNGGNPCDQQSIDANNLDELASSTGGHAYLAGNSQGSIDSIATEIARALKTQFLIGYKSTNTTMDGHRRGVKVKVNPPEGSPKLKVWTKNSYYARKEKPTKAGN